MLKRKSKRSDNLLTPEVTPDVTAAIDFAVEHLTKRAALRKLAPQVGTVAERRVTYLRCLQVSRRTSVDGRGTNCLLVDLNPVLGVEEGADVLAAIVKTEQFLDKEVADDQDREMWLSMRPRRAENRCECCGSPTEEQRPPMTRILEYSDTKAAAVIDWAEKGDVVAQEVLRCIVTDMLALGLKLPPNLAAHVSSVYSGKKMPTKHRTRTLEQREWEMAWAVHLVLQRGGFRAHGRRAPINQPKASAQWIVTEALRRMHMRVTPRQVEEAWRKNKNNITALAHLKEWEVASVDGHVLWSFSPLNT